jgi:hypothetical protein
MFIVSVLAQHTSVFAPRAAHDEERVEIEALPFPILLGHKLFLLLREYGS